MTLCGLTSQWWNGGHGFCYIWRRANTTFHHKNIVPAVKHGGGGSVTVRSGFGSAGPGRLDVTGGTVKSAVSEDHGGERPAVGSRLYSRTMI